ncbi:MAG: flagellar hook-associated protein FlgK [Hydrogenophilales bacterium 28-61-23]|nr:MAG: flagellar hook-associated protein FlgK [Hydrogenophilales bacterium 28-61-23]
MATGTLGIALTGLAAAQAGIRTTEHNISNINTAGFRRQEVDYSARKPEFAAGALFGTGVGVSTVRNLYSQFQDSQVLLDQAQLSRSEAYAAQASQIDTLAGNANSGLTSALDAFFSATQTVATDPTSNAARQVMLSSGRNLASRFNTLSSALDDIRVDTNREVASTVARINTYASQIGQLGGNIARAEAMAGGQPANDLRDQRDQLVSELNKLINVVPVQQGDGTFSLFIGNGQPLVRGSGVTKMSSVVDPTRPEFDVPALDQAGGNTLTLTTSMVTGGKLGGLLAVRDAVLQPAMQELDRLALVFSAQFNAQHGSGFDKLGTAGTDFFTAATTLSQFVQPAAQTGNTGNQVFTAAITDYTEIQASDYELSYDGASYTLTRLSDGASSPAAAVATINGVSQGFTLTAGAGTAQAGDRWLIRPSHGASGTVSTLLSDPNRVAASSSSAGSPGDNANALLLADLQTLSTAINGTDTFSSAYAQLISRTATLASEADINVAAYETLTSQARVAQQSISGVNLDEEAANLIRFQQAYQASAKAMQVASSLFDELIGMLR